MYHIYALVRLFCWDRQYNSKMPVKLAYSAFSSVNCSMKMPMWRT